MMRRIAAASQVALFSWMLIAPLLAPGAEANLPPCCRRHGKHHCSMMEPLAGGRRGVQTIQEKCPFQRVAKTTAHTAAYHPEAVAALLPGTVNQPAPPVSSEPLCRLALEHSRLQRGPPQNSSPFVIVDIRNH